ncbi:hypothetical protein [Salarchaeum sp. JOR-1]|uniref:hypothetical protein n=1 Tax=Salarchaeum sp. JOR-1 TaxID=2599399 RepID=UPI00119846DB|nr:hypothetical protein [Salarchaeum sp. JOR-1]QDX41014.1 hypothetical protein FQU85_08925 [Salarchaeum sp. JOR-1]
MVIRADGPADEYREIDRFDGGVGWIAHPDEAMQRASHVLEIDGDAWVIDPVDAPDVDDLVAEFGEEVAGVVVLSDRHARDADAFGERHDAPVYVPSFVTPELSGPSTPFSDELEDTGFEVLRAVDVPGWREAALYDGETLVVADAVGDTAYFTAGDERIGVHPMLRAFPPNSLRGLEPARILSGHGPGVLTGAASALDDAYRTARRNIPRVMANSLKSLL